MSDPALDACDAYIAEKAIDRSARGWRTQLARPPRFPLDEERAYFWRIETNKGPIRVKLLQDVAPDHVSSTIFLTRLGFYDDTSFHRVIPGFMAQGGCPLGNGTGGPGYQYEGEFDSGARHDRPGLLSMANAGPGTDGSQFFLTFVATPWLDGKHTIFGEVVEGADTLQALESCGSEGGRAREPLKMTRTSIEVQ